MGDSESTRNSKDSDQTKPNEAIIHLVDSTNIKPGILSSVQKGCSNMYLKLKTSRPEAERKLETVMKKKIKQQA